MRDPMAPIILWLRRDLRLADNPALTAALQTGREVIPVFIHDETVAAMPAAPKWRLGQSIAAFQDRLSLLGTRLVLRKGKAAEVISALLAETGASAIYWSRGYEPKVIARDMGLKQSLSAAGIEVQSFNSHLIFEPWTVQTGQGGFYRVFTPFWRNVRDRPVENLLPPPARWRAPALSPRSDDLSDWAMGAAMQRGAKVVAQFAQVGEDAAEDRLDQFLDRKVDGYAKARDRLDLDATSGLSENLAYGEISARQCWHAGQVALRLGAAGAERFLQELVWREFAYHLMYHSPHILSLNWKTDWDGFPWREASADFDAWCRGRTGVDIVDAAMREMYVTGRMHNRARMITASYLTKHLMTDWRLGQQWFADHLIDWDPAANAMGWQWVAGSGPDAAPFFRIFNPELQAQRFDPQGAYRDRWLAEGRSCPHEDAMRFYQAIPGQWKLSPRSAPAIPSVSLKEGREKALFAYENR